MKILIAGGAGMLGHKLVQVLSGEFDICATVRDGSKTAFLKKFLPADKIISKLDVGDFGAFEHVLKNLKPDVVINAVGVIKQLPEAGNFDTTIGINSIFPQRTARIAEKYGFKFINISTDCVFSGKRGNYTEVDISDAEDLYGKSKFLGETPGRNCLTIRTSIIGRELGSAHSLLEWFISNRGGRAKGFTNAIYTGFPTLILGRIIRGIVKDFPGLEGLYHVSSDPISKFELLRLINDEFGLGIDVRPEDDFYMDRSLDSSKFRKATGFQPMRWDEMVQEMRKDEKTYK